MVDRKNALRLPRPIELAWAVVFGLLNSLPTFFTASFCILFTLPFISWWNRKLSVKLTCIMADWTWWLFAVVVEKWGRSRCHYYGDKIPMRENAFMSSNHITFMDWAFLFTIAGRRGRLGVLKFFAKKSILWIPAFGWGMWLVDSLMVSRNWLTDKKMISQTFHTLKTRKLPFWVVSFLEGTRKTPKKLAESQDYAKKKDLPVLQHVLLPRTKGFVATIAELRDELDAVYDVTYAYSGDTAPGAVDAAMRRLPDLHFHIRRFPLASLPTDEKALSDWCIQLYVEKDRLLEHFKKHGVFPDPAPEGEWAQPYKHEPIKLWAPYRKSSQ